jgi:hypothetical protein
MYRENDIVSFKLVSGEETVARLVSETDGHYEIYKPLSLMPGPQGLALAQSMMSSKLDKNIMLNKSSVVMHSLSREEMVSAWWEATSGIKTATNSKILMG